MPKSAVIDQIVEIEWALFSQVNNSGGIASCQENPTTFCVMRIAQMLIWQDDTLKSYLNDLLRARNNGVNLMTEKYARMMAVTHPAEYNAIKDKLEPLGSEVTTLADQIMAIFNVWDDEFARRYPKLSARGRQTQDSFFNTSTRTYLRGELLTYSAPTLTLCLRDAKNAQMQGNNLAEHILCNTARYYGYSSLSDLEQHLG